MTPEAWRRRPSCVTLPFDMRRSSDSDSRYAAVKRSSLAPLSSFAIASARARTRPAYEASPERSPSRAKTSRTEGAAISLQEVPVEAAAVDGAGQDEQRAEGRKSVADGGGVRQAEQFERPVEGGEAEAREAEGEEAPGAIELRALIEADEARERGRGREAENRRDPGQREHDPAESVGVVHTRISISLFRGFLVV